MTTFRVKLSSLFAILIYILIYTLPVGAVVDYTDQEQHGLIRLNLGYLGANGFIRDATGLQLYQGSGFLYGYALDISGRYYRDGNQINYNFAKDPSRSLELSFSWDNPKFFAQYNPEIRLEIPEVQLAFGKNRITGFEAHTMDNSFKVFAGQETYIPISKTFTVNVTGMIKLALLEDGSSSDILEYSEVIIANGQILTRGRDYEINYLAGEAVLLIPVEIGSSISTKFLLIPVTERAEAKGTHIEGVSLTTRKEENYLSAFYFRRGENDNRLSGLSGQISSGPFRLQGELAFSADKLNQVFSGYTLDGHYANDKLDMNYQLRNISPGFLEMGVNSNNKGLSQLLDFSYKLSANLKMKIEHSKYIIPPDEDVRYEEPVMPPPINSITNSGNALETGNDGEGDGDGDGDEPAPVTVVSGNTKGTLEYQLTKSQFCQVIVQNQSREAEQKTSTMDYSLGYTYQTRPLTLGFTQSLNEPDNRTLKLLLNYPKLRINSNYAVDISWDESKTHKIVADISSRPAEHIDWNCYVEYADPFGPARGNVHLLFNSNWTPSNLWSFNGAVNYFTNFMKDMPGYFMIGRRYNLMSNYHKDSLNSSINLAYNDSDSQSAQTDDATLTVNSNMLFWKEYQLCHFLEQKFMREYDVQNHNLLQQTLSNVQTLTLNRLWREKYQLSAGLKFSGSYVTYPGYQNFAGAYEGTLGFNYQPSIIRQTMIELSGDVKGDEQNVSLSGHFLYPLGAKAKIDYVGRLGYSINLELINKNVHRLDLTLPQYKKFTPSLQFVNEYARERASVRKQQNLTGKIKYDWKPMQGIFIEGKQDFLYEKNFDKETRQTALSISLGIEIEY